MKENIKNLKANLKKIKSLGSDLSKITKIKTSAIITSIVMLVSGCDSKVDEYEPTTIPGMSMSIYTNKVEETEKETDVIEETEIETILETEIEEIVSEEEIYDIESSINDDLNESETLLESITTSEAITDETMITGVSTSIDENNPINEETTETIEKENVTTPVTKNPIETTKRTTATSKTTTPKSTTKKTTTTPKVTTTKVTTTTVTEPPVTEPPATEPPATEPPVTEPPATEPPKRNPEDYRLEEIPYDAEAFNQLADRLKKELFNGCGVGTSYGGTYGEVESVCILALLNNGRINGDVLAQMLGNESTDAIGFCTRFIYTICQTQEICGSDVNFEKYTLDPSVGQFLNSIDDAYRNGRINDVLYDMFMNGNIPGDYLYNPAILSIICSYDKDNTQIAVENVDEICMNSYINNLVDTVRGYSYSR